MSTATSEAKSLKSRIFLTKNDKITVFENNLVSLTLSDGTFFEALEPRRLFPVNREDEYITLLGQDNGEVAMIRNISDLDPDSRAVIRQSLNDYYLVPNITRIISATEKYGTLHWHVETDRGIKEFDIRNRNSDIRIYDDGRVRIRDSDDNRYIIENFNKLDPHSKKLMVVDI